MTRLKEESQMEDKILKLLGRKDYVPANVPELLRLLKLGRSGQQDLQKCLKRLATSGEIVRLKGNRYIVPRDADLIPGRIQITRGGRGFLRPDDSELGEIAVSSSDTATALHDDHVLVRRNVPKPGKDRGDTGTVVRVLERKRSQLVGTYTRGKSLHYVVPDDPRISHDIYVPQPRDVGRPARDGDKVVVEIRYWESRQANPEGEVVEVLGPPTEEGVDMLGVLRQYDLPLKFPRKVLQEVRGFGTKVSDKDMADRTDCRDHDVITIDPADAKDFDDAFFLKRMPSGQWKLWVHIADVSHYVEPGSALDVEAHRRGNSTYLVDRVIPMLPEALSNELCSLKPDVDRLTKCVEFVISEDGRVVRSRFFSAIIHSKRRYSYEEAMAVLDRKPADEIEEMLQNAGRVAMKIRKLRFKAGSLALDFHETKIRLDDHGRVDRIETMVNDESHQLIEEFMLLANEAVAGKLLKLRRPTIHRVHEEPDPKRLAEYREDVLSHHVRCGNLEKPAEVQKLLKRLGGLAIGPALKIGFLKSLMRARYAVESLGHYGLAKTKYAHFTSPIRRYADLIVHRSLFENNAGKVGSLKKVAEHISTTERNSADAERDSKEVKLYAYLKAQLDSQKPHRYSALVTDLRNFGFFVDVTDLGMSGLVPLSVLQDDFYELDSRGTQIRGRRSRRIIRLGDQVEVQVAKVDSEKKQVDFKLAPSKHSNDRRHGSKSRSTDRSRSKRKDSGKKKKPPKQESRPEKKAKPTTKRTTKRVAKRKLKLRRLPTAKKKSQS